MALQDSQGFGLRCLDWWRFAPLSGDWTGGRTVPASTPAGSAIGRRKGYASLGGVAPGARSSWCAVEQ